MRTRDPKFDQPENKCDECGRDARTQMDHADTCSKAFVEVHEL